MDHLERERHGRIRSLAGARRAGTRRLRAGAVVAVTLAVPLAAVGGLAAGASVHRSRPGSSLAAPSARAQAHATRGGNLVVDLVDTGWSNLDVASPYTGGATWPIQSAVYDTLFGLAKNGSVTPELALSYSLRNGGKTFVLNLRHGVEFQDGTPFNAQAVVFNLKRQMDPANHSLCLPLIGPLASVAATGPYTVDISLKTPYAALPWVFASSGCAFMASPTAVKKYGSKFGLHPVGAGPFKFKSQVPGSQITFTRWMGYWQKGEPYLNGITFEAIASDSAALNAVQAGNAQVIPYESGGSPTVLAQAATTSGVHVFNGGPSALYNYIRFEEGTGPFVKLAARRAVDLATNQAAIGKYLDHGLYKPIESPISPASWAYPGPKTPGYPAYNLAKAKKLVKKLGGLSFTLTTINSPDYIDLADALKAEWAQAGIHATINTVELTELLNDIHANSYQALMFSWGNWGPDPDTNLYFQFHAGEISADHFNDPVINKLLDEARAATSRPERLALYRKFTARWNQDLPWDLLPAIPNDTITASSVRGLVSPAGLLSWTGVWLKK